jgi:hypothetical protein
VETLVDGENGPVLPTLLRNHFRILAALSGFGALDPRHPFSPAAVRRMRPLAAALRRVPSVAAMSQGDSPRADTAATGGAGAISAAPVEPGGLHAPAAQETGGDHLTVNINGSQLATSFLRVTSPTSGDGLPARPPHRDAIIRGMQQVADTAARLPILPEPAPAAVAADFAPSAAAAGDSGPSPPRPIRRTLSHRVLALGTGGRVSGPGAGALTGSASLPDGLAALMPRTVLVTGGSLDSGMASAASRGAGANGDAGRTAPGVGGGMIAPASHGVGGFMLAIAPVIDGRIRIRQPPSLGGDSNMAPVPV